MAVEARHLNLFPPQIIGNRETMMMAMNSGKPNAYNNSSYCVVSSTAMETVVPTYASLSNHAKNAPINSDSGLTYAAATTVPVVSRKRPRDVVVSDHLPTSHPILLNALNHQNSTNSNININIQRCGGPFTFLGEDISLHLQQQQLDFDRFIAQHTEKVRLELEERRKRFSRRTAATVEESIMKKLKAKEEEIDKIGKLNCILEERVKSLCLENQIWRDLAQTNEATANALRSNLEQVLAQVQDDQHHQVQQHRQEQASLLADDAQSCCASNFDDEVKCTDLTSHVKTINSNSMCRSCGREESCVLLLPCRHLCLCTVCGSSVHTCPVCFTTKTASLHVNLSPS